MERTIYWKTLMMDSVPVTDQLTYSFFEESAENKDTVAGLTEDKALHWLFAHPIFRVDFACEFFPDPGTVHAHFGLKEPFTQSQAFPGDIDLLLLQPEHPDRPVAFECKRVKIIAQEGGAPIVNRLSELDRGILQAGAYRALGFHQTYLLVILLDDGRVMKTPNIMFRYNDTAPIDKVFNIPWHKNLHPDVGVVYVRINQMTGKHIDHSHSIGYFIDKPAYPITQTAEMTNKIHSLLTS